MAEVVARALSKSFRRGDGSRLLALDSLDIHACDGEFVCVVGPSGSGKSTTLHILAGLTEPDSGEITVSGESARGPARFGYVFQHPRLLNWKTVRGNLYFVLAAAGVARQEWRDRADHYLELTGLTQFSEEYPLRLSGGMQQRVAIARALVIEPGVLLMDEPFSSLDELTARQMRVSLLRIWQREQRTIFFVTHNALEAAYLADRVYVLSKRPATVLDVVRVDLCRPRDIDDVALIPVQRRLLFTLLAQDEHEEDTADAAGRR
jgi:ABC-type nitrate/sulfonate/bicarbonate transport system ATPase subunit